MPLEWIEKLENEEVRWWIHALPSKREVLFAADRSDQYPCVVAEVPLDDSDAKRFELPKNSTVIMSPVDWQQAIDDP